MNTSGLHLFGMEEPASDDLPARGVGWVLRWAGTLVVLLASAVVLTGFSYQLSAEQALLRAARVGLREAACERATSRSVEAAVRQALAGRFGLSGATEIRLLRDGTSVKGAVRSQSGDRLSLALAAPCWSAMPRLVVALVPWQQDAVLTARVEKRVDR